MIIVSSINQIHNGGYNLRLKGDKNSGYFIANILRHGLLTFFRNVRCVGFTINGSDNLYDVVGGVNEPLIQIKANIQDVVFKVKEELDFSIEKEFFKGPVKVSDIINDTRISYLYDRTLFNITNDSAVLNIRIVFKETGNTDYVKVANTIQIVELSPVKGVTFNFLDDDCSLVNLTVYTSFDLNINAIINGLFNKISTMFEDVEYKEQQYTTPSSIDIDISQLSLKPLLLNKLRTSGINTVSELIDKLHTLDLTPANIKKVYAAIEEGGHVINK